MTDEDKHHDVELRDGDHAISSADVTILTHSDGTAQVSLNARSGHLPPGTRADLVDAVLDLPDVQASAHLQATLPLGDSESLERLRERTDDMTSRAAGSTILVDSELRAAPTADQTPPEHIG